MEREKIQSVIPIERFFLYQKDVSDHFKEPNKQKNHVRSCVNTLSLVLSDNKLLWTEGLASVAYTQRRRRTLQILLLVQYTHRLTTSMHLFCLTVFLPTYKAAMCAYSNFLLMLRWFSSTFQIVLFLKSTLSK